MKLRAEEERSNVPLHVPRTLIIGVPYLRRVKAAISKNKSRKPSIVRAIFLPSCSVLLTRGDRTLGSTSRRERRAGGGGHVARRYYARERALRWMVGSYPTHLNTYEYWREFETRFEYPRLDNVIRSRGSF